MAFSEMRGRQLWLIGLVVFGLAGEWDSQGAKATKLLFRYMFTCLDILQWVCACAVAPVNSLSSARAAVTCSTLHKHHSRISLQRYPLAILQQTPRQLALIMICLPKLAFPPELSTADVNLQVTQSSNEEAFEGKREDPIGPNSVDTPAP